MQTDSLPPAPLPSRAELYQSAYALLSQPLSTPTDSLQLVLGLRPQPEDYALVFTAEAASIAQAHYESLYAVPRPLSRSPHQTELRLWLLSSDELRGRAPEASQFPGGYADIAHLLQPGIFWVHWKYVAPSSSSGMAYDGLAYVRGRWVFFPKPFRALLSEQSLDSASQTQTLQGEPTATEAQPPSIPRPESEPQREEPEEATSTDGSQPPAVNQVWQVWKE